MSFVDVEPAGFHGDPDGDPAERGAVKTWRFEVPAGILKDFDFAAGLFDAICVSGELPVYKHTDMDVTIVADVDREQWVMLAPGVQEGEAGREDG